MNYILILAGGTGSRAGGSLPKQFQLAGGKRILWRSMDAFKTFDPFCRIVAVVHPHFMQQWETLLGKEEQALGYSVGKTQGGETRLQSVANGLEFIKKELEKEGRETAGVKVFIHDSARPLVSRELIERGERSAAKGKGAIPVVPLTDSIRKMEDMKSMAADRNGFRAVQTPQIFLFDDIYEAYNRADAADRSLTDDASVAERNGIEIITFDGDPENFKVTNPVDFKLLEVLLSQK